jgi:hypothetical protein
MAVAVRPTLSEDLIYKSKDDQCEQLSALIKLFRVLIYERVTSKASNSIHAGVRRVNNVLRLLRTYSDVAM